MVEAWAEEGEPTTVARVAQARAFFGVGLLDRASARLRDLVDAKEPDALRLAGEVFLARGWPSKAQEPLRRALELDPNDDKSQVLWEQARLPPSAPPEPLPDDASLAPLLAAARQMMASGAFIKARALLERAKRLDPDHPEVRSRLWALDGDFEVKSGLAELAARHAPDLSAALPDLPDEADHTEAVSRSGIESEPPPAADGAFPSLFRDLDPPTEEYEGTPELTAYSAMERVPTSERARPTDRYGSTSPSAGDTQIQTIIGARAPAGGIHKPLDAAVEPFDLQDYKRRFGMAPSGDLDQLEPEDEELVVLTRREADLGPSDPTTGHELLELDPLTEEGVAPDDFVPDLKPRPLVQEALVSSDTPTVIHDLPPGRRRPQGRRVRRRIGAAPWWAMILALLLFASAFFMAMLGIFKLARMLL